MPEDATSPQRQVLLYLMAGGVAALANFGSRFVFSRWMPFELAVIAAFGVGLLTGFTLMRRYVFAAATRPLSHQATGYVLVNLFAAVQTLVISSILLRLVLPPTVIGLPAAAVAHAVGVIVPVVSSYFGHRWITFR